MVVRRVSTLRVTKGKCDVVAEKTHDWAESQLRKEEIGKLLSEIWRIKGLSEDVYGPDHPITKKLSNLHQDAQALLRRNFKPARNFSFESVKMP